MGLEEPPHCPFDVMEACRTGLRRDSIDQAGEAAALRPGRRPSATGRTTVLSDKKCAEEMDVWRREQNRKKSVKAVAHERTTKSG